MGRAVSIVGAIAVSIAVSACGGGSTTTVTTTATVAIPSAVALHRCTEADGSGYGWSASVSGISCDQVGRFIRRNIFPRSVHVVDIHRGQTADFQTGGYACEVAKGAYPRIGYGWHVTCGRGDRRFAFFWL
jgi:hypothetical protein